MTRPIRMRLRLDGDVVEIRALIDHPMETGLRKDSRTGELVPLHFIRNGDGVEELYEPQVDPAEERNRIGDAALQPVIAKFRATMDSIFRQ